jgi:hypothetical protein
MKLADLRALMAHRHRGLGLELEEFSADPLIASLGWPDDVVEQWLYDHGDNAHFRRDYGSVDLSGIAWSVETITTDELNEMPTGASEHDLIEEFAANPDHWVALRNSGIHEGVPRYWEELGTWKRPPILLDRGLLKPPGTGLQVVEGRVRVGVLRGRHRQGSFVAMQHQAWVGHPTTPATRSGS